jgi:S-adenosylmethionine hydrolase
MGNSERIITLLTDFGLNDYYVGAMKGVMLTVNPSLTLVDISHLIPPHDILSGAFALKQSYSCFPAYTIHLAVVDPGVGTQRKPLVVSAGGHIFVAPDNGILTHIYRLHPEYQAYEITASHYFRKPVSSTFHGRDIFAPVAAWISRDIDVPQLGPPVTKPVELDIPVPKRVKDSLIEGSILAVDHFGNLITNLLPTDLPVYDARNPRQCKVLAGQREIATFHRVYSEGNPGDLFVVPGSSGYLEIVVRNGSAASVLNLKTRSAIGVILM